MKYTATIRTRNHCRALITRKQLHQICNRVRSPPSVRRFLEGKPVVVNVTWKQWQGSAVWQCPGLFLRTSYVLDGLLECASWGRKMWRRKLKYLTWWAPLLLRGTGRQFVHLDPVMVGKSIWMTKDNGCLTWGISSASSMWDGYNVINHIWWAAECGMLEGW